MGGLRLVLLLPLGVFLGFFPFLLLGAKVLGTGFVTAGFFVLGSFVPNFWQSEYQVGVS